MTLVEVDPVAIIALLAPWIGIGVGYLHQRQATEEKFRENNRVIMERIAILEQKMGLLWGGVEKKFTDLLLHGNPIPLDSDLGLLLLKHNRGETDNGDQVHLIALLEAEAMSKKHTPTEDAVMILLATALKARVIE